MTLTDRQIERVRVLTGHLRLDLHHVRGWDEHLVENYLALIDDLETRLAASYDEFTAARRDRQRRLLCGVLGVRPGPGFLAG